MSPFDTVADARNAADAALLDLRMFAGGEAMRAMRLYFERMAALYLARMADASGDELVRMQTLYQQAARLHAALLPNSKTTGECR